jgi:hypothetical protein
MRDGAQEDTIAKTLKLFLPCAEDIHQFKVADGNLDSATAI